MREIKFRGITFKGDWVYGDLSNDIRGLSFDEKQWIRNNLTENISEQTPTAYWQETTKRIHWNQGNSHCNAPVRQETLGQFTGLRDSKRTEDYPEGQEIFEGDLVKTTSGIFKVEFKFGGFCLIHLTWHNEKTFYDWLYFQKDNLEVIGNIYETSTT